MKYEYYKSTLTDDEFRDAEKYAKLIRDVDEGIRVCPIEKSRLYSMPDKIRIVALEINKEPYRGRGD